MAPVVEHNTADVAEAVGARVQHGVEVGGPRCAGVEVDGMVEMWDSRMIPSAAGQRGRGQVCGPEVGNSEYGIEHIVVALLRDRTRLRWCVFEAR